MAELESRVQLLERENEILKAKKLDQTSQRLLYLEQELHEKTLMAQNLAT